MSHSFDELPPAQRIALLDDAAEVLACPVALPMGNAARAEALQAVRDARDRLRHALVFRPLPTGWLEIGQGPDTVRWPQRHSVDVAVVAMVLRGEPELANGLLYLVDPRDKRTADAMRGRIKRLAGQIERAGYRRLATAVHGVKVNDKTAEVYAIRRYEVLTT